MFINILLQNSIHRRSSIYLLQTITSMVDSDEDDDSYVCLGEWTGPALAGIYITSLNS